MTEVIEQALGMDYHEQGVGGQSIAAGRRIVQVQREEILSRLTENREAIRRYGVRRLGLFGSVARGENTSASDLDFLVEFDQKSFDAYMDLKVFLEGLFACPVDLVLADTLKPRLRETISNEIIHAQGL